jgi:hypothetical protein
MRTQRKITMFVPGAILLGIVMALSGCYTILMNPGTETQDLIASAGSGSTYAPEINYSAECTSCHSAAELADRSYDASRYDLRIVHGIAVDPYGWKSPTHSRPWWNSSPQSPIQTGSGTVTTTSSQPPRPRPSEPTRPSNPDVQSNPPVINTAAPTSTPTAPSAPSAPTGTQIAPTTTPAPAPQSAPVPPDTPVERRRPSGSTRGDEK